MAGINITWDISQKVDDAAVKEILHRYGCSDGAITNQYQKWVCKGSSISIQRFEKKLVFQGNENEQNIELMQVLSNVDGLNLDSANGEKYARLLRFSHNAILCMECRSPSMLIEGKVEGLDLVFRKDCGHIAKMQPPIFMVTNRILPDVNVLIGGHISKGIQIGLFEHFEIVIPDFVMGVIDTLPSAKKTGSSNEIERLKKSDMEGKITIINCKDGHKIPRTKEEMDATEDDTILEIAKLTNSILFTSDDIMKDKALIKKRPTIYLHPEEASKIKIITKVRSPEK
jgi:rRNA-processing protein FCF1